MVKSSSRLESEMLRHSAWAAGGYCTGPPATRTVGTRSMGGFDPPHGSPCTPTNQTSVQREDDEGDGAAASSVRQCQGPFHTFPPSFPPSSASVRPPLGACVAYLQRSAKVDAPGSVNFVPAVAYHFCLNLHAAFTQPGASTLADICTSHGGAAPVFLAQKIARDMYHGELHFVC